MQQAAFAPKNNPTPVGVLNGACTNGAKVHAVAQGNKSIQMFGKGRVKISLLRIVEEVAIDTKHSTSTLLSMSSIFYAEHF